MIYIVLLIFLTLIYLNTKKGYYIVFFILVTLITAIRFDVGKDYMQYYFQVLNPTSERYEFFVYHLIRFSHFIKSPLFFFTFSSIFITGLFTISFKKYSKDIFFSSLVFLAIPIFWINSMTIIRQFMALALILYGSKYIFDRKFWSFLIIVFLAGFFHKSAYIAIILYPLSKFKLNWASGILLLIFTVIGEMILITIIEHLFPIYFKYIEYQYGDGEGGQTNVILFLLLSVVFVILKSKVKKDEYFNFFFNSFFIGTAIYFVLNNYGHAGMRSSLYFTMFLTLLLPYYSNVKIKGLHVNITKFVFYIMLLLIYITTLYIAVWKGADSSYIPYQTIFFKE